MAVSTWRPVTDGQIQSSSVGAVAVSESNPDVVYIGMGETELRGNIMQGDGVYKSTDAGKTWKHVGLADTQAISRIRIHPTNPDIVYVSALGHPYAPNTERGVFRSKDGGATWQKILYRDDHSGAVDLCIDPHNPNVLFAAIWDVNRTPWGLTSGGPGSGLFKTTDGGDHWTDITRNPGLPQLGNSLKTGLKAEGDPGIIGKIGVAVSGGDSNRVYAIVENDNGGLYVLGRCRRHLEAHQRRAQRAPARLLLQPCLCRPQGQRHRLRNEHVVLQIHRRRQDFPQHADSARR